jgi:phospholipid/cholesterol/gamma-HCH transport system substrate-binding protein
MTPTVQPWKTVILAVFALGCALLFAYLYSGTGAKLPFTTGDDYRVSFSTTDAGNLAKASDVRIAGVVVGEVESIENRGTDGAHVTVRLDEEAGPLHEGARVNVGERSLVGEGVVSIVDGDPDGDVLESKTTLPAESLVPSVQLHDVLRTLDAPTRASLQSLLTTLGDGVDGNQEAIAALFDATGKLGRSGDIVAALAAQNDDLTELTRNTADVLAALDSSRGQLGRLVESSNRITRATSGQVDAIRQTVQRLPATMSHGQTAFSELEGLTTDLRPVAENLRVAAPYLTTALQQLPETATDLRGLLPSLDSTLKAAPATLDRVPRLSDDLSGIVPSARTVLADANPMLRYISPYGRELAAFFTNFRGVLGPVDEVGINYLRLAPIMGNTAVVDGVPVYTGGLLHGDNPYPSPGGSQNPTERQREFTRLHEDPR